MDYWNNKRNEAAARLREVAEKDGYKLISYESAKVKAEFEAPCGTRFSMSSTNFLKGCRLSNRYSKPKERFMTLLEEENHTLLTDYKGVYKKVLLKDSSGNEFWMCPSSFTSGHRFSIDRHTDKAEQLFIDAVKCRGYELIGSYVRAHSKVHLVCPAGHDALISPANFRAGKGCSKCSPRNGYNPSQVGTFYLYRWSNGEDSFLKAGITGQKMEKRLKQQQLKTTYTPEPIMVITFEDGKKPVEIEHIIKTNLRCGVVSAELFGDGFTETLGDTSDNIAFIKESIWKVSEIS